MTDPDGRGITRDELGELIDGFGAYACRVDRQPSYAVDAAAVERWVAGDRTPLPAANPDISGYLEWLDHLADTGRALRRLRVVDDPPTDWQRWAQWAGQWSAAHGEQVTWVSRSSLPHIDHGGDWWLFDGLLVVDIDHDDGDGTGYRLRSGHDLIRARLQWWEAVTSQEIPHQWPTRLSPTSSPLQVASPIASADSE